MNFRRFSRELLDFVRWPFFVVTVCRLQPNLSTREKQLDAWASLVLDYCQHQKLYTVSIPDLHNSELFENTKFNSSSVLFFIESFKHCRTTINHRRASRVRRVGTKKYVRVVF